MLFVVKLIFCNIFPAVYVRNKVSPTVNVLKLYKKEVVEEKEVERQLIERQRKRHG